MSVTNHISNAVETIESHPLNSEYFNGKKWGSYVISYDPTSTGPSGAIGHCVNQTISVSADGTTTHKTYPAFTSDTATTRPYLYTSDGQTI